MNNSITKRALEILEKYDIPRKKEIQSLIGSHMSHWYKYNFQPKTFYENLLCISDYVATKGLNILKHEEK